MSCIFCKSSKPAEYQKASEGIYEGFEIRLIKKYLNKEQELRPILKTGPVDKLKEKRRVRFRGSLSIIGSRSTYYTVPSSINRRTILQTISKTSQNDILKDIGYDVVSNIYEGTCSVELAISKVHKQKVAIKVLQIPNVRTGTGLKLYKYLEDEITGVKNLTHESLLKIYEYILAENVIFVVMEYGEYGTLYQFINENNFITEDLSRKMYQQIAEGLSYCHGLGYSHRSINCENIYVCKDLKVKLANFQLLEKRTDFLKDNVGSIVYTAPEVKNRSLHYGKEADMWSMGVVLYMMLFGVLPYSVESYRKLWLQEELYQFKVPGFPAVEVDVVSLMERLLCPASKRITISRLLRDPWLTNERRQQLKDTTEKKRRCTLKKKSFRLFPKLFV